MFTCFMWGAMWSMGKCEGFLSTKFPSDVRDCIQRPCWSPKNYICCRHWTQATKKQFDLFTLGHGRPSGHFRFFFSFWFIFLHTISGFLIIWDNLCMVQEDLAISPCGLYESYFLLLILVVNFVKLQQKIYIYQHDSVTSSGKWLKAFARNLYRRDKQYILYESWKFV